MRSISRKRKAVGRKSLLRRFIYRYQLVVSNEDEQRMVLRMRISYFRITCLLLIMAFAGAWTGIVAYRNSPKQVRAMSDDYRIRQTIVDEALRLDSLEQVVELQNRYITNIQDIIAGAVSVDTVYSVDSLARERSEQLMERSELEATFMREYEEAERYNLTSQSQPVNDVRTIGMFRPTAGLVIEHFGELESHIGVDIAASPNQSVTAVMDGTVLFATYTSDMGYTICVVHPGELISVYKNCESILRKAGDKVRQGDVIALVGRGNDNAFRKPHLHFELWYQGHPLDPEKYILFQ